MEVTKSQGHPLGALCRPGRGEFTCSWGHRREQKPAAAPAVDPSEPVSLARQVTQQPFGPVGDKLSPRLRAQGMGVGDPSGSGGPWLLDTMKQLPILHCKDRPTHSPRWSCFHVII